jgi:hypothetical protein
MNYSQKKIVHSSKEITMAKIKVSQATIDSIKKMGMEKALKSASKASPEMKEALTRMYGAKRVQAAGGAKAKPAATSADAARGAVKKVVAKKESTKPSVSKSTPATKKPSTTSNPMTAAFNALSPYGNKEQKFKSPTGAGLATRKSVPGKPSIGEKISNTLSGKSTGGAKKTATSVSAENAKRMGISVAEYNKRLKGGK